MGPYTSYNLDRFRDGTDNVLFITGLSASGKSTIAKEYCDKYDAIQVSLDFIHNFYLSQVYSSTKMDEESRKFWLGYIKEYKYGFTVSLHGRKTMALSGLYNTDTVPKRVENVIKYAIKCKKRYIIEGIQIYIYKELWKYIINKPLIMMDINSNKAMMRSIKRDIKEKQDIHNPALLMPYYKNQKGIYKKFRAEVEKQLLKGGNIKDV